jgi:hypothetical protein
LQLLTAAVRRQLKLDALLIFATLWRARHLVLCKFPKRHQELLWLLGVHLTAVFKERLHPCCHALRECDSLLDTVSCFLIVSLLNNLDRKWLFYHRALLMGLGFHIIGSVLDRFFNRSDLRSWILNKLRHRNVLCLKHLSMFFCLFLEFLLLPLNMP